MMTLARKSTVCWWLFTGLMATVLITPFGESLEIKVKNGSTVVKTYKDSNAVNKQRSVGIGYYEEITGILVFPNPRNACSMVAPAPAPGSGIGAIAFVPNYDDCRGSNAFNIYEADYLMMISYSSKNTKLADSNIPQAIINKNFSSYLIENVIIGENDTFDDGLVLVISEGYLGFYEWLLLVIGLGLLGAITMMILIFFCTCSCRYCLNKWRKRGLTHWRINQLPRRRYHRNKETCESCSICLEDFQEREHLRVLPCDHVFHPACVDEWLKNWNRVCPLCKTSISRNNNGRNASSTRTLTEQDPFLSDVESSGSSVYGSIRLSAESMESVTEDNNEALSVLVSNDVTGEQSSSSTTRHTDTTDGRD